MHNWGLVIIAMQEYVEEPEMHDSRSSNWVPGSPGLPVELGGATTTVTARARRATTSSSNASVIRPTTLCAMHPFI